jgi:hypothetical protein
MSGITYGDLDNWFSHHPPKTPEDIARYEQIREAGKVFAKVVLNNTPGCADQTVAIRTIREAVMLANATIACNS